MTTQHTPREALEIQTNTAPMRTYIVNDMVVLAGQPQPDDWQKLAQAGFRAVINIRSDPERAAVQARAAEAAGLRYIYAPVPAYELEAEDLDKFAEILDESADDKMFIHCRSGTRVALLWMLYRIVHQGWSPEQARAELQAAGYDDDAMETFDFCAEDFFERTEHLVESSD
jgi:uncharacterized protein (TIGR01244 family)